MFLQVFTRNVLNFDLNNDTIIYIVFITLFKDSNRWQRIFILEGGDNYGFKSNF